METTKFNLGHLIQDGNVLTSNHYPVGSLCVYSTEGIEITFGNCWIRHERIPHDLRLYISNKVKLGCTLFNDIEVEAVKEEGKLAEIVKFIIKPKTKKSDYINLKDFGIF